MAKINPKELTKGELRKLNALRKSLGDEIADDAFVKWHKKKQKNAVDVTDPNIPIIEEALTKHLDKLRFPRGGGYTLRRGRGRIIVEPIG